MRRCLPLGQVQRELADQRHSLGVTVFGIETRRNALTCEWTKNYTTGHMPRRRGKSCETCRVSPDMAITFTSTEVISSEELDSLWDLLANVSDLFGSKRIGA